jgi:hypothetical protein
MRKGNILIHNTSTSMVQLPAAALGALALGAQTELGAWAAPGAGDDGADGKVGRKRNTISERRFRLLMRTRHGHLHNQTTLGSRLGSLY